MKFSEISKRHRIAIVISFLWLCVAFLVALNESYSYGEFLTGLFILGVIPVSLLWGIAWIRSSRTKRSFSKTDIVAIMLKMQRLTVEFLLTSAKKKLGLTDDNKYLMPECEILSLWIFTLLIKDNSTRDIVHNVFCRRKGFDEAHTKTFFGCISKRYKQYYEAYNLWVEDPKAGFMLGSVILNAFEGKGDSDDLLTDAFRSFTAFSIFTETFKAVCESIGDLHINSGVNESTNTDSVDRQHCTVPSEQQKDLRSNPGTDSKTEPELPVTEPIIPIVIQKKITYAWIASVISGFLGLVVTLLAISGTSILGFSVWSLFDVTIVFGLAFGIYKRSRICAVLMLVSFILGRFLIMIETGRSPGIIALIYVYFFYQGVVGTIQYHRFLRAYRVVKPAGRTTSVGNSLGVLITGEVAKQGSLENTGPQYREVRTGITMINKIGCLCKAGRIFQILALNSLVVTILYFTVIIQGGVPFGFILVLLSGCSAVIHWYIGKAIKINVTWAKVLGIVISIAWILGWGNPLVLLIITVMENAVALIVWSLASLFIGIAALCYLIRGWKEQNITMESHKGVQSRSESPVSLVEKHDASSDNNSAELTNHQNPINDHLSPRKEVIIAIGSLIIFFIVIIFGAISFGRQADQAKAFSIQYNSLSSNNTPRGSQDPIEAQKPSGNWKALDRMIQETERSIQAQSPVTEGRLLKSGMSKSDVLNLLGEPDSVSISTLPSGSQYETWFYRENYGHVNFTNDYVTDHDYDNLKSKMDKLKSAESIQAQRPITKGKMLIIGMSKSDVLNLLGEPDGVDISTLRSGRILEIWYYKNYHGNISIVNDYVHSWSI